MKCATGCIYFYGGDVKHHKDCPFYKGSFTEMYDNLVEKIKSETAYLIIIRFNSWETKEIVHEFREYSKALKELENLKNRYQTNVDIHLYESKMII